jgi:hypothetical protein
MNQRKLCGYDLNGWKDRVARNWVVQADGFESVGDTYIAGGLLRPCIVQIGEGKSSRWIGGSQASLAPHGRGGGWGDVGNANKRKLVAQLLKDDTTPVEQIAASLSGLARGAKFCAISIDDHPAMSERFQERLLEGLARGKVGRGLLVWRSVLAVLGCITSRTDLFSPKDGLAIGVIGQVADGFTIQHLRLRLEAGRQMAIFAPERRQTAQLLPSNLGYSGLYSKARSQLKATKPSFRGEWVDQTYAASAMAFTGSAPAELLRNDRSNFDLIMPPEALQIGQSDFPQDAFAALARCDIVLFETQTSGEVRNEIAHAIAAVAPSHIHCLGEDIVARGALEAARRFAEGEPIYFDFLPQISTIVLGQDGASNYDLIDRKSTLPAGRVYRSPEPANFAIQANKKDFVLHLRKELSQWPRQARVDLGSVTSEMVPVQLRVEQVPAAGRASLIVDAPSLARQFVVDWEKAEEVQKSWGDLIDELGHTTATIPKRLSLPCGMEPWHDNARGEPGLFSLLNEYDGKHDVDWKTLADKLAARPNRHYCISSDGELPVGIPSEMLDRLDRLTQKALDHIHDRMLGRITADNQSLKFLTWQFRRAPLELPSMLLEAWEARNPLFKHPFVTRDANWTLVYQGLGRTCRTEDQERSAFSRIFIRDVKDWSWRQETAAAAFLLSRSDTAPLLLERKDVERLVKRVLIEFRDELDTEYTRFNYAPFLLGGLLRWRLKVKNALVVGQDPLAEFLRDAILRTLKDLGRSRRRSERLDRAAIRYEPLLQQLLEELEGHGSNPDLLMDLFDG